jgi:hypothetical protein
VNGFGEVLQGLMDERGLVDPADLSELLGEAGRYVPEEEIRAYMEGDEWVDGYFPGWVAEVLDLDAAEMGALAYAVAYGQAEYPP